MWLGANKHTADCQDMSSPFPFPERIFASQETFGALQQRICMDRDRVFECQWMDGKSPRLSCFKQSLDVNPS